MRSVRVQQFLVLGGLAAYMPLSSDMYVAAFPQLANDFGSSPSGIQLTLTAFMVGTALGHLLWGPLTDRVGRRPPLLLGTVVYAAASLACAVAPTIYIFIATRFAQGVAAAAGSVIARAIVRDLYTGRTAVRYFSRLLLVSGAAPVLGPAVAGVMLGFTSWRSIFVVLAAVGVVTCLAAFAYLPESLSHARRHVGGLAVTGLALKRLALDRQFVTYASALSLAGGAFFAYIAASSFILRDIYGLGPAAYGLVFGVNAAGLVVVGQLNAHLVHKSDPRNLLWIGCFSAFSGAVVLVLTACFGSVGLWGVLPAFFLVVASQGFITPNATALALAGHPGAAGSASAVIGVSAMLAGAIVAPLTGVAGEHSLTAVGVIILACFATAILVLAVGGSHSSYRSVRVGFD